MFYPIFEPYHSDLLAFSTSRDGGVGVGAYGSMSVCSYTGDSDAHVARNGELLAQAYGFEGSRLLLPRQTHGCVVRTIDKEFLMLDDLAQAEALEGVDAMMSHERGVVLGIQTADCVPVLFYHPGRQVIAVAHCGWRGVVARLAALTALSMRDLYGTPLHELKVAMGPSISQDSYEVGQELIEVFEEAQFPIGRLFRRNPNTLKHHLDLAEGIAWQLWQVGVARENMAFPTICTFKAHEQWFSARVLGIKSGRILSGMMLR